MPQMKEGQRSLHRQVLDIQLEYAWIYLLSIGDQYVYGQMSMAPCLLDEREKLIHEITASIRVGVSNEESRNVVVSGLPKIEASFL